MEGRARILMAVTFTVLCPAMLRAQAPAGPDIMVTMEGHTSGALAPAIGVLGVEDALDAPPVKGAPYSAQAVTEMTQVLADGNRISNRLTASVARDSEGRTRREETLGGFGVALPVHAPPHMVFVSDPVAGASFVLEVDRKIARKLPRRFAERVPPPAAAVPAPPAASTKSLGARTVDGLEVQGTRTTTTIPAGAIGNAKPLTITSERWMSPELQVVVESQRKDPMFGEVRYRLTGITRAEPDRALFEVPPGFTVTDLPPGPQRVPLPPPRH